MMLLVSGASSTVVEFPVAQVGRLYEPAGAKTPLGDRPYAIDNGAYSGFDEVSWLALLERARPTQQACLWVACPDVVGDAATTLALFDCWQPQLSAWGWPPALVLQDGLEPALVPWHRLAAVFVGGTTAYKLSEEAAGVVREARRRGLHAHMGRVNSIRRIRYAERIGCTSVDGSSYSRFARTWIPHAVGALAHPQTALEIP